MNVRATHVLWQIEHARLLYASHLNFDSYVSLKPKEQIKSSFLISRDTGRVHMYSCFIA